MTDRPMSHDGSCRISLTRDHARADMELYGKTRHGASCDMPPRSRHVAEGVLLDLAERLRRLSPSPRNPDRFHEEKSEIVHALRLIAREVAHG